MGVALLMTWLWRLNGQTRTLDAKQVQPRNNLSHCSIHKCIYSDARSVYVLDVREQFEVKLDYYQREIKIFGAVGERAWSSWLSDWVRPHATEEEHTHTLVYRLCAYAA